MKRLAFLAALTLTACGDPPPDNWPGMVNYQVTAKQAMEAALKDPKSAEYKDVYVHKYSTGYVFCGLVNAKNGFGGYNGFKRFVAAPGLVVMEGASADFEAFQQVACNGESKVVWF